MPDIPFKKYVFAGIGVNLFVLLTVVLLQKFLPPQVPLFYGLPQSESQLVGSLGLTIPSIISVVIILINTTASYFIKDDFLKKTLIFGSLLVTVFSLVTTIKIILLVGSF